jgi:hypothetical protein
MTDELRQHLLCIITDAIEWAEHHLAWLAYNSQESDRGAQLRDTERSIGQTASRSLHRRAHLMAVTRTPRAPF